MTLFTKEEFKGCMTADEARKESNKPQLQKCMDEIKSSVENGLNCASLLSEIYPEVAEALATLGYDVEIRKATSEFGISSTRISWDKSDTVKKGTITMKE